MTIQYRGHCSGPRNTGWTTALYPTEAKALKAAEACRFKGDTAWVNPEFAGPLDTVMMAVQQISYTDWRRPARRFIASGESFTVGDIMVADHHVTPAVVARWLLDGKAVLQGRQS